MDETDSPGKHLAVTLGIEGENDEDISRGIVDLLTSAMQDDEPLFTLTGILHEVSQAGGASLLDPLDILPLLLQSIDEAAMELMSLMGKHSSPKEVVMAVQEAIERLESTMQTEEEDRRPLSPCRELSALLGLYSLAIPRLKLRRKSAQETTRPLLEELGISIQLAAARSTQQEGRDLILGVAHLVEAVSTWTRTYPDVKEDEMSDCNEMLKSLLDSVVESCAHSIHSSLAQRTFEKYFPRLVVRSSLESDWKKGKEAIESAINAYSSLGFSPNLIPPVPSTSSMILFAHSQTDTLEGQQPLPRMMPTLLASIQTNFALDEALSILLRALNPPQQSGLSLSPDIVIPLCTVIPSLCSLHPDPLVRQQAFRILSILLSSSPLPLRLQILRDLTSDSDLPQMCVAAVGLLKEAIMEALATPTVSNPFSSPILLQVFGPILFRSRPLELLSSSGLSLDEFKDSYEPQRLVECLSLYYVLLQRDKLNKTGIRDVDMLREVEKSLLGSLRSTLNVWMGTPQSDNEHTRNNMLPFVPLQMSLERVDMARRALGDAFSP